MTEQTWRFTQEEVIRLLAKAAGGPDGTYGLRLVRPISDSFEVELVRRGPLNWGEEAGQTARARLEAASIVADAHVARQVSEALRAAVDRLPTLRWWIVAGLALVVAGVVLAWGGRP